jgi:type I restriction enzyme S subunit
VKVTRLEDVCTIVMGQAPPGNSYNDAKQGVPLVAGAGDFEDGNVAPTKFTTAPTKLSHPDDIIVAIRATIGMRASSHSEVCLGRGVAALRPGPQLDRRYLWHWIGASGRLLAAKGRGATFRQVNREDIGEMCIRMPPLEEQQRIAGVLDIAQRVRSARALSVKHIDALSESYFIALFGDPDKNRLNWDIKPISQFVSAFEGGRSFAGADEEDVNAPYRVLRVSAVTSGMFNPAESRPVPRTYVPPARHSVQSGDLLISRANTTELVGAVALVEGVHNGLLLPDKIWRFVWRDAQTAVPEFIWQLFRTRVVRNAISRRSTGTSGSMKNISASKLMGIEVIQPPVPRQRNFAQVFRQTRKLRAQAVAHLGQLDALFDAFQQRAFNGEL